MVRTRIRRIAKESIYPRNSSTGSTGKSCVSVTDLSMRKESQSFRKETGKGDGKEQVLDISFISDILMKTKIVL